MSCILGTLPARTSPAYSFAPYIHAHAGVACVLGLIAHIPGFPREF